MYCQEQNNSDTMNKSHSLIVYQKFSHATKSKNGKWKEIIHLGIFPNLESQQVQIVSHLYHPQLLIFFESCA